MTHDGRKVVEKLVNAIDLLRQTMQCRTSSFLGDGGVGVEFYILWHMRGICGDDN